MWSIASHECLKTLDWMSNEGHTGVIRCLQADDWRILSAADDKMIKVWNLGELPSFLRSVDNRYNQLKKIINGFVLIKEQSTV